MGFLDVTKAAKAEIRSELHDAAPGSRMTQKGQKSLAKALATHAASNPSAAASVARALWSIAQDAEHARCIDAARIILDRLDGPVERKVKLSTENVIEGITLDLRDSQSRRSLPPGASARD